MRYWSLIRMLCCPDAVFTLLAQVDYIDSLLEMRSHHSEKLLRPRDVLLVGVRIGPLRDDREVVRVAKVRKGGLGGRNTASNAMQLLEVTEGRGEGFRDMNSTRISMPSPLRCRAKLDFQ